MCLVIYIVKNISLDPQMNDVLYLWGLCNMLSLFLLQLMNEQLPLLIQGFRHSETKQDSATAQLHLINASKEFIQVSATSNM